MLKHCPQETAALGSIARFASFYETASADGLLQYLLAFLVLLSTVKLWHLFRLNPKINVFTATLGRAWSDMSGFLLILGLLLVAYSTAVSARTAAVEGGIDFQESFASHVSIIVIQIAFKLLFSVQNSLELIFTQLNLYLSYSQ